MRNHLHTLFTRPSKQDREKHVAFVSEKIYGTVTLLAVNAGLFFTGSYGVAKAVQTIIATSIGIWMASIFAEYVAYMTGHNKRMPVSALVHEVAVHRGLLYAALPSLIMILLAATRIIEVRTALLGAMAIALSSMTLSIIRATRHFDGFIGTLIPLGVQFGAAAVVILVMSFAKQ